MIQIITATPTTLEQLPAAARRHYHLKPGATVLISLSAGKRTLIIQPAGITGHLAEDVDYVLRQCNEIQDHLYDFQFKRWCANRARLVDDGRADRLQTQSF